MTIKVTKDNIKCGWMGMAHSCPVALAIEDKLGCSAIVSCRNISLVNSAFVYRVPKSVSSFISKFDLGKPVKPFSFVLRKRG